MITVRINTAIAALAAALCVGSRAPAAAAGGDLLWADAAGGHNWDYGEDVACCRNGDIVVTGTFIYSAWFDRLCLFGVGGQEWNMFLVKYRPDGTVAWGKRAGAIGSSAGGKSVAVFPDGSCVVTGQFWGQATFGSKRPPDRQVTLTSAGNYDIFVARYRSNGLLDWAMGAGGAFQGGIGRDDYGMGIAACRDGSCVVTGCFYETAQFDARQPNDRLVMVPAMPRDKDIFVAKYTRQGALKWVKRAGAGDIDMGYDIAACEDGSCVVTGFFRNNAVFGSRNPGDREVTLQGKATDGIYVARYNSDGTLAWVEQASGAGGGGGAGIGAFPDGSCVVAGQFWGVTVFGSQARGDEVVLQDPGLWAGDIFLVRYNADGTVAWGESAGGPNLDGAYAVAANRDGSCAVTGHFSDTAVFGPTMAGLTLSLKSKFGSDAFVAKYDPEGNLSWVRGGSGDSHEYGTGISTRGDGTWAVIGSYYRQPFTLGRGEPNETTLDPITLTDIFIARFVDDSTGL